MLFRSLADAVGGRMHSVVERADRRIEHAFRAAQDARHLAKYFERSDQTQAFADLMTPPEAPAWALHFLGMGGVGKTMLIRYITVVLAPKAGRITSRVDFDYLDPGYPVEQPERLLVELAEELKAHYDPSLYRQFYQNVEELHLALAAPVSLVDPLASLRRPEFEKVLRSFVDWIRELPPVVFILDTCEELAKFQAVAGVPPSIAATLEILEAVHEAVRTTRVVFAGRRPLAMSGYEWELKAAALSGMRHRLPDRKAYLRLHPIRGFSRQEAALYFERRMQPARPASEEGAAEMEEAILKRSLETGVAAPLVGDRDDLTRYSPFDLNLYLDWLEAGPKLDDDSRLTVERVRNKETDPYIEFRLLRRLSDEVRPWLPATVLLRRFDLDLLALVIERKPADVEHVFRELAEQEWMDYQPASGAQSASLEIDKKLYCRLVEYYQSPKREATVNRVRERLGPTLRDFIGRRPIEKTGLGLLEAALRLLPVADAAALWQEVEARIIKEHAWGWAMNATGRLLGAVQEKEGLDNRLRGQVLATQAAASIHLRGQLDLREVWEEILKAAPRCPLPAVARALAVRAVAGKVLGAALQEKEKVFDLAPLIAVMPNLERETPEVAEQCAGGACAVLAAFVENGWNGDTSAKILAAKIAGREAPELGACAEMLRGLLALRGPKNSASKAAKHFRCALDHAARSPAPTAQRWLDWRAPECTPDRVRLTSLAALYLDKLAIEWDQVLAWQEEAAARLHFTDSERLVSWILHLRLQRGPLPAEELERWQSLDQYSASRRPECWAHRSAAPLFLTLIRGWLALGRADDALALARACERKVAEGDFWTAPAVEQALWEIGLRMRWPSIVPRGSSLKTDRQFDDLVADARMLNGLAAEDTPSADSMTPLAILDRFHRWWRGSETPATPKTQEMLASLRGLEVPEQPDERWRSLFVAVQLDLIEIEILYAGSKQLAPEDWSTVFKFTTYDSRQDSEAHKPRWRPGPTKLAAALKLAVRHGALHGSPLQPPPWCPAGWERAVAMAALCEGEVLAMRLPVHAAKLLEQAAQCFDRLQSPVERWIALTLAALAWARAEKDGESLNYIPKSKAAEATIRETAEASQSTPLAPLFARISGIDDLAGMRHLPPSHAGWALRVLRMRLWVRQVEGARGKAALRGLFARIQPVPPELLLFHGNDRALALRTSYRSEMNIANRILRWLAWSLIALAGGILVLFFAFFVWQLKTGKLGNPFDSDFWTMFLGVPVLIFGCAWFIFGLICCGYWIRALWHARHTALLRVRPAAPLDTFSAVKPIQCLWEYFRFPWHALRRAGIPWSLVCAGPASVVAPGLRSYESSRNDLDKEILNHLSSLRERLTGRSWRTRSVIGLDVPLEMAGQPWEASIRHALFVENWMTKTKAWLWTIGRAVAKLLSVFFVIVFGAITLHMVPESVFGALLGIAILSLLCIVFPGSLYLPWRKRGRALEFFREAAPLPGEAAQILGWKERRVISFCGAAWPLLAEEGWRGIYLPFWERPNWCAPDVLVQRLAFGDSLPKTGIVHLIGNPMRTQTGWQIQFAGRGGTRSSGPSEPTCLRVSDLPLERLALIVIQGEPVENVTRNETAREHAASLRSFGADLFAAGARAVLVLPRTPAKTAESVLRAVAKRLRDHRAPSLNRILNAARAARERLLLEIRTGRVKRGPGDPHLEELAFDVTVFARRPQLPPECFVSTSTSTYTSTQHPS